MGTALELAATLAAKSPIAMRLAKESMNRVEDLSLKDGYRTEQDYTARLQRFEDAAKRATPSSNAATPTGSGAERGSYRIAIGWAASLRPRAC